MEGILGEFLEKFRKEYLKPQKEPSQIEPFKKSRKKLLDEFQKELLKEHKEESQMQIPKESQKELLKKS